jgi:hypothetical protein
MSTFDLNKPLPPALWELPPIPADGIRLGTELSTQFPIYATPAQLSTHTHVIGSTGVGKTYFLEAIIEQMILRGQGLCIIDPHGDLYNRLLSFCAYADARQPQLRLAERVIPFNVSETRQIIGFNPMQRAGRYITYQVVAMMEVIRKCWGQTSFEATPRLARWLYNVIFALIDTEMTFVQAYHLVDPTPNLYRPLITERITNPRIKAEWTWMSQQRPRDREERLESTLNRIKPFVEQEIIRRIIGQHTTSLDFNALLSDRKILLVNLARQGVISEDDQRMLGTMLVYELLTAAFARPEYARTPFFLLIDEFSKFVFKDICEILDGGRKFGLHLILAHQHLNQLKQKDPEVYYSTLTNARIKAVFGGLEDEDLEILAKELYTGEYDPDEIKDEVWQTKFRPVETTRLVKATNSTHSSGDSSGMVTHDSLVSSHTYIPGSDLWSSSTLGSYTQGWNSGRSMSSGSQFSSSTGTSESLVPWYEYHEFNELSSRQFRSLEEQIYIKKAQMKRQDRQHLALLVPGQRVQLIKTPTFKDEFLRGFPVTDQQKDDFLQRCFEKAGCFKSPADADREIEQMEEQLLRDYEASLSAADEDVLLIEQDDRALVDTTPPPPTPASTQAGVSAGANMKSSPAKLTRPQVKSKKKKTVAGREKKDAIQPELPGLDITDNPVVSEE